MKLQINTRLDYWLDQPTDVLLQLEPADLSDQMIDGDVLQLPSCEHMVRISAHDGVGERIWLRLQGQLLVNYSATVTVLRNVPDLAALSAVPLHRIPGDVVQYLLGSRYSSPDRFHTFVESTFGEIPGGAMVLAMRDWVQGHLQYVPGSSDSQTTAADTFVSRQGVCRDYAHLLITLVRAAGVPARIASVYAPGVNPPDFHAVAEVFLEGAWHLVDPTGMATAPEMVKIGVGRDAADVAFLTAFGETRLASQSVEILPVG